jgi:hypothetical protein
MLTLAYRSCRPHTVNRGEPIPRDILTNRTRQRCGGSARPRVGHGAGQQLLHAVNHGTPSQFRCRGTAQRERVGRLGDGHATSWEALSAREEQVRSWVGSDGLSIVKIEELLARSGCVVPYRTLHRFAVEQCGFRVKATTMRVVDSKPGVECQIDFAQLGLLLDAETGRRRRAHAVIFTAVVSQAHVRVVDLLPDAAGGDRRVPGEGASRLPTSRSAARCTRFPSTSKATTSMRAPTVSWSSCSPAGSWSRPTRVSHPAGAAPTGRICPRSGPATRCGT